MLYLSIIVPFYGVEKYIRQCLASMYEQDIPETEYEVICINDCSPDKSEEIVLEFASKHTNLRLIRHETNKRLGAARNTGLRAAQGKYVWFVDSDDYITSQCLHEIITTCENNELEMLHFSVRDNYHRILRKMIPTEVITGVEEERIMSDDQCVEIHWPWNRVFNRQFLLRNNLFFNDLYGGDVIHTIQALDVCQRIKNVDKYYYQYRVDNMSSDTRSFQTGKKIYEMNIVLACAIHEAISKVSDEWREVLAETDTWRMDKAWKSIYRLPLSENIDFYQRLNERQEIKDYILKYANSQTCFVLTHPVCVRIIHPFYMLTRKVRDISGKIVHSIKNIFK